MAYEMDLHPGLFAGLPADVAMGLMADLAAAENDRETQATAAQTRHVQRVRDSKSDRDTDLDAIEADHRRRVADVWLARQRATLEANAAAAAAAASDQHRPWQDRLRETLNQIDADLA